MREILFRGKRVGSGEWVEGCLHLEYDSIRNTLEEAIIIGKYAKTYNNAIHGCLKVDPSSVGQYTGLTDKNGKKIFEGDIVGTRIWSEFDDTTVWVEGTVVFENGGFFIQTDDHISFAIGEERHEKQFFEILRNIHDNPELLEVNE